MEPDQETRAPDPLDRLLTLAVELARENRDLRAERNAERSGVVERERHDGERIEKALAQVDLLRREHTNGVAPSKAGAWGRVDD